MASLFACLHRFFAPKGQSWRKPKRKLGEAERERHQRRKGKAGLGEYVSSAAAEQETTLLSCMPGIGVLILHDQFARKINLIYGGGSISLMGLISQTVFDGGFHVLGVIPGALLPHEVLGVSVGEVKTVADMHERKSEMASPADAFITLPGGYGTMEELLEMIAWSQLGIHEKCFIGLLIKTVVFAVQLKIELVFEWL
ncbi:hypothetical protein HPP92_007754 [Vanilla planifolia]|uniref:Cytokinin riboside 5'-monophosphate phosphoribohydrolase n=1 Tax=Vanilla planifolia TaxID=51239 RepID=A0A835RL38_VANPL|nr:hypothetical protein HPP92_007754 [Vanilla planifolia]